MQRQNSSFSLVYHIFLGSDQARQRRSASSSAALFDSSSPTTTKIMMQTTTTESSSGVVHGFNRGHHHTFEEANEPPPPTLSRLPPDGHEFPPDYRDPAASTIYQVTRPKPSLFMKRERSESVIFLISDQLASRVKISETKPFVEFQF